MQFVIDIILLVELYLTYTNNEGQNKMNYYTEEYMIDEIKRELHILLDHVTWAFAHRHILAGSTSRLPAQIREIRMFRAELKQRGVN